MKIEINYPDRKNYKFKKKNTIEHTVRRNYFLGIVILVSTCIVKSEAYIEGTKHMSDQKKSSSSESTQQHPSRPQDPKPPFPYDEIEVTYENKSAGITLSGTLTLPRSQGPFPTVLLIPGMGPVDRNGEGYYGLKPSLVLADHLTRNGSAVLRVDKRGVGKSTGTFDLTVTPRDLAGDVLAGIEYLKTREDVDHRPIGLIGHSEGGLVAAMVAAQSNDVAFVVLMAGAVGQNQTVVEQAAVQLHADGASTTMIQYDSNIRKKILEIIQHHTNAQEAHHQLRDVIGYYWATLPEEQKQEAQNLLWAISPAGGDAFIGFMNSPYNRFLLTYDAQAALAQIKVPLLALYGEFDFMSPRFMLPLIKKAMEQGGNKDSTLLELPKLNHSLQTCKTGSMAEYATIEETIAPVALDTITKWILERTVNKYDQGNV